MRSSIFNFDQLAALKQLPRRDLKWLLLVALCGALVFLACSWKLNRMSRRSPTTTRILARKAMGDHIQMIFTGTSHVEASINPEWIEKPAMNLVVNGGNYEVTEVVLKTHLPKWKGLDTIVIEADLLKLVNDRIGQNRDYLDLYELGLDSWDFPLPLHKRLNQKFIDTPVVRPVVFTERVNPYTHYWKSYRSSNLARQRNIMQKKPGHRPYHLTMPEDVKSHLSKTLPYEHVSQAVIERNLAALQRCCRLVRERGLKLVFLRTPHHELYGRFDAPEWDGLYARLFDTIKEAAGGDFTYWDFGTEPAFERVEYHDPEHLNFKGAERFTRFLSDYIESNPL